MGPKTRSKKATSKATSKRGRGSKRKQEEEEPQETPEEQTETVEQPEKKTKTEEAEQKKGKEEAETTTTTKAAAHEEHEGKILEKGHIFFFYRPKVEVEEAHSINDVQRFYALLSPLEKTAKKRLIILAKKKLPDTAPEHKRGRNKFWAFVDKASTEMSELTDLLKEERYTTKTRGERHVPAARPCGEGYYSIVLHDNKHTHLVYVLEIPHQPHKVQEAFNIHNEGSFLITVKNPYGPGREKGLAKKAHFPEELKKVLSDYSFVPANPVSLLDYENAEMVLISAAENIVQELGTTGEQIEKAEQKDVKKLNRESVFKELKITKEQFPIEPLAGRWK